MDDPNIRAEMDHIIAEQEQLSPEEMEARMLEESEPIVARLQKQADDAVSHRKVVEVRWLEDLRQFMGLREGDRINKDGTIVRAEQDSGSTIFVNITRPKTNRTEGRLNDILFPADDKNWGIQPTPVPELSTVARRAIQEAERAAEQASNVQNGEMQAEGLEPEALVQKAKDLAKQGAEAQRQLDEANQRSERMAAEIDDHLTQCNYPRKARDAISWACKLGVGIIKGPVLKDCSRRGWKKADDGTFELDMEQENAKPSVECVKPWDFFPDWSATSMEDCEFVYQRHLPSKGELRKMARKLKFNPLVVKGLLEEGPGHGTGPDLQHIADIRALSGEMTPVTGRYVVWEYHGPLALDEIATLIKAAGGEEAEARAQEVLDQGETLDEQTVIAYFCNGKLLKISEAYPMASGSLIYSVFSLEKGEASILGAIGVPRMMADSQQALNSAWRMMMDNGALSVGPQVLVDQGQVTPADGDWTMKPGKVWNWDSRQAQSQGVQPFNVFNVPMNQAEIAGIIQLAMSFIDEETAMPRVAEGGGSMEQAAGVSSTVGGLAMLMNAAGVNIRRMVKNWDDDITAPLIERIYDWEMQFSDKDEIKGDMAVEARGTSTLLERETRAQHFAAISQQWSVHPVLGPMLKPHPMASMTLQSLNINPAEILITSDEFDKLMAAQAQQAAPEDPQWAARKEIAQIDAGSRIQVAEMQREVAIIGLSEKTNQTIEKINGDLAKARIKADSDERTLAVEVAVEGRNARRAQAMGREPAGSGGAISMGSQAQ